MSLAAISAAVEARLAEHWRRCPIRGLNEASGNTPLDSKPYLEIQFPVSTSEQISTGTPGRNVWRTEGAIRFVLNIRRGKGVKEGAAWVDELAALFRGKVFDGVRTFAPSMPILDDRNDDGLWFALSFAVPFEFDLFA